MSNKIEKNYVQYRNEKSVYVNGKNIRFSRFISDLEKQIRKGRCASFDKTKDGYKYQLLEISAGYEHVNYEVEIGSNTDSDLNIEMNRLCVLANSDAIKKKYAKFKKDVYTKPKHIIGRNFIDNLSSLIGVMGLALPAFYLLGLITSILGFTALGAIMGNSGLFLPGLFKIAGALEPIVLGISALSILYTITATTIMSIKEIIDNEKHLYESKEKERNRVQKELEKEKTKKSELTKEQSVNKDKVVSKKCVPVTTNEHNAVVSFLGQRYRELEVKRNNLIVNGASREQIEDVTNEMNAIVYKVNSMMGLDNSVHTSSGPVSGPVRKLNK